MRRLAAALLTMALMGLLLWNGLRRPARSPEPGPESEAKAAEARSNPNESAEARIDALLESAWSGDVPAYLASFGGPIRQRLEREIDERGRAAFADDLRRAARARKSHAVFGVEPEGADSARVAVETVYPDRNERQTFRLERGADGWLVTEVETIRTQIPKAKFGSPATYQEPEGVPVQTGGLTVETGEETPGPSNNP
jgi:hypothetical protein